MHLSKSAIQAGSHIRSAVRDQAHGAEELELVAGAITPVAGAELVERIRSAADGLAPGAEELTGTIAPAAGFEPAIRRLSAGAIAVHLGGAVVVRAIAAARQPTGTKPRPRRKTRAVPFPMCWSSEVEEDGNG